MPAPAEVIAARPPAVPTMFAAAAAAQVMVVAVPGSPVTSIDGTKVPVVPAFVYAGFSGAGAPGATIRPVVGIVADGSGLGTLSAAIKSTQQVTLSLGNEGTATGRIAIGAGGKVVLPASLGATGEARTINAVATSTADLSAVVTPKLGALPTFYATGTATATVTKPA